MDANALQLLQELSANPHMITQMQDMLTLLHHNRGGNTANNTNKDSYSQETLLNSSGASSSSPAVTLTAQTGAHQRTLKQQQKQQQQQQKQPHLVAGAPYADRGQQRAASPFSYNNHNPADNHTASRGRHERRLQEAEELLEERARQLHAAEQRATHTEKELARLRQRLDQLQDVVEAQREELRAAKERHVLKLAEVKHTYETTLRQKEEAHAEALQQVLKAKQLRAAAQKFEERVAGLQDRGAAGVNTRLLPAKPASQPLKREREEEEQQQAEGAIRIYPTSLSASSASKSKLFAKGSESGPRKASEVLSTSPAERAKASTMLTGKTTSASSRKRRTPRTPSLTYADRVHSRSPAVRPQPSATPPPPSSLGATATAATQRPRQPLPPSAQEGVRPSANFVSQYATGKQQPHAHPSAGVHARVAGRLPAGVPNTCSGASSPVPGPTRSPSPADPSRGPDMPRRFIFTGLANDEPRRLREAVAALGQEGAMVEGGFDEPPPPETTHIVVRGAPRSVKALCGVVAGKWLVSPEYILNSKAAGFWLDEYEEGGLRIFPPPLKCQRFLLQNDNPQLWEKLAQVIEYGGGEVVREGSTTARGDRNGVIVIHTGDDLLRYATQQKI